VELAGENKPSFRVGALGAAATFFILAAVPGYLKLAKVYGTAPNASLLDAAICVSPELHFAAVSGLVFGALSLLAMHWRALSFALVAAEVLWSCVVLNIAILEHQGWERSGTILNWRLFSYTLAHMDELSALIGSETNWKSWLELGGVTALGLLPAALEFVRHRTGRMGLRPLRAAFFLVPVIVISAGLFSLSPKSPRVHPFARSVPMTLLRGALSSTIVDKGPPLPPPVETSVLVRDKLAKTPPVRTPDPARPENLLIVVLESTRWDATTVYSPTLPTTPNLLALAEHALVPDTVYVDMPHTSKALVSILCGYPARWVQNIEEAEPGGLNRPCLAHILDGLGYGTAFFQSATGKFENRKRLTENFGYKFFRALENYNAAGFEQTNYLGLEDKVMTKPLLGWIDEQTKAKKPFFASVLTTISHHDYGLPSDVPYEDIVKGVAQSRYNRYVNTVKYADAFIGDVMQGLKDRGLLESTLVVVVGDHGQAFFEHGRKGHNDVIWEEGLRVPLIVSNPKLFPDRKAIPGLRRQVDIAPTALRALGVSYDPAWFEGQDLATAPGYESVITSCWYDEKCMAEHVGALEFIEHFEERPMEAYDVVVDPKQQNDLLETEKPPALDKLKLLAEASKKRMLARREEINASFRDVDSDLTSWALTKEPVPEHLVYARYGEAVEILGWDGPTTVDPGTFWDFTIYFRCLAPTEPKYRFFGHLETIDGRRVKIDHDPAKGRLKLENCKEGMIIKDHLGAYIPPTFPQGEMTLWYGIYRKNERLEADRTSLEVVDNRVALIRPKVTGKHEPELKEVLREAVTRTMPPTKGTIVNADFGKYFTLVSYEVEPKEVRRRSEFEIITTWRVNKAIEGRWRMFLHADPVRGKKVRQDIQPVRGLLPMASWKPGTYVQDRFPVYISHKWGWPTGEDVKLFIGVYADDERLTISDPGTAIINDDRVQVGAVRMVE
jgi:lipoteichoic acid synthase